MAVIEDNCIGVHLVGDLQMKLTFLTFYINLDVD